ncbi:hypothetical protein [Enterobacter cloacae]|uniref:hypothetical protein n=1 Tax=Enterobacter cloacae TaxID=550 RepID=UPI0019D6AC5C|nr:hypothetical protein [Enterobacter cloacae]
MSTITKERIANLLQFNSEGSDCQANAEQWEVHELARIALASLEAEPVITVGDYGGDALAYRRLIQEFAPGTKLFTAPPAPVSVPEWTNEQCMEFLSIAFRHAEIKGDFQLDDIRLGVKMVNGSRAAMLQGADGNSPVMNDYPETLPCPVSLEPGLKFGKGVATKILLEALQSRANYSAEIEVIKEVCRDIKDGDLLAAAKINGSSELVNTAYKLPKPIKDHRLNSGPDADDYYAGYQAGWNDSIGESEEVDRTAYDIESFGIFSVTHGEDDLMLQIEQFRFGTGKCPQIGKENMVPKFALQAIINRLQEHCDSMGNEALIDILSTPVGEVQGHKE